MLFGSHAKYLDIKFITYESNGTVSRHPGPSTFGVYFDENDNIIGYSNPRGMMISNYWIHTNSSGEYSVKTAYKFSMTMEYPENIKNQTITLYLSLANGSEKSVELRYNPLKGTFDGIWEFEPLKNTPAEILLNGISFDYAEIVPTEDYQIAVSEDHPNIGDFADNAFAQHFELADSIDRLREKYSKVDMFELEQWLSKHSDVLDEEIKEDFRTVAKARNDVYDSIEKYVREMTALAKENGYISDGGQINDIVKLAFGDDAGLSKLRFDVNYSETYLDENGYTKQSTETIGDVYIRYEDGNYKMYIPYFLAEYETEIDGLDLPFENTTPENTLAMLMMNDYLADGSVSLMSSKATWSELDDTNSDAVLNKAQGASKSAVVGILEYVKSGVTSGLSLLDEIINAGEKIKAANIDGKLVEKGFAGGSDMVDFWSDIMPGDEELKQLKNAKKDIESSMSVLESAKTAVKNAKGATGLVKPVISALGKISKAAVNTLAKASGSMVANICFGLFDCVTGGIDMAYAYLDLDLKLYNNIQAVKAVYDIYENTDSLACELACLALRGLYAKQRILFFGEFISQAAVLLANITADAASITGVMAGQAGLVFGVCSFTVGQLQALAIPCADLVTDSILSNAYDLVHDMCSDGSDKNGSDNGGPIPTFSIVDPAGYIYEAVASNRIEGATVTCYYKDDGGNPALWDATEAEQVNPLISDADGRYSWDTPIGDYMVMATKTGYYTATSVNDPEAVDGWLPVPPPQMNVNLGLISMYAPQVSSAKLSGNQIRVEFSQYMDIAQLTSNNSLVAVTKNGTPVPVNFNFVDSEVSPTKADTYYGRILYITPQDGYDFDGEIALFVDGDFANYADTIIGDDYNATSFGQIAGAIEHSYPNRMVNDLDDESEIIVRLLDTLGNPIAGQSVSVNEGLGLYEIPSSVVTDEDGRAVFAVHAVRAGDDTLLFTSDEAQVTLNVRVNPLGTTKPQKPTANIEDFATVEFGTQLVLSCDTPGAIIRYTLNDTCPCDDDALVYTGPITITDNMFIRIAAWTEAGGYSERLNLHITCNGAMPKNDISVTNVVDDTTITANVNLTSVALSVDGIIYVGAYKDGKLVSISRYDAQNNLAISIDKNNAETLKIMWWNNAMMPMCAAKEIALN